MLHASQRIDAGDFRSRGTLIATWKSSTHNKQQSSSTLLPHIVHVPQCLASLASPLVQKMPVSLWIIGPTLLCSIISFLATTSFGLLYLRYPPSRHYRQALVCNLLVAGKFGNHFLSCLDNMLELTKEVQIGSILSTIPSPALSLYTTRSSERSILIRVQDAWPTGGSASSPSRPSTCSVLHSQSRRCF